jgi:hypothetical protein
MIFAFMNTVSYLTQFQFMGMWYLIWVCTDGTEVLERTFAFYDELEDYALG